VAAVLLLPAASVNVCAATLIVAVPVEFGVGVKVAVYVAPLPVKDVSDPPEVVMSSPVKLADVSDRVNVMVSVSSMASVSEPALVTVTVGA